jgi:hypothetical protein
LRRRAGERQHETGSRGAHKTIIGGRRIFEQCEDAARIAFGQYASPHVAFRRET